MDLTPLIDIVFLLLIFFMLTSSFAFQTGVTIQLPKAVTADIRHRESLVIIVSEKGRLYLGNRWVTMQELRKTLGPRASSNLPILIQADRDAALGRVVAVWDLCRSLGIRQVNIATRTEE